MQLALWEEANRSERPRTGRPQHRYVVGSEVYKPRNLASESRLVPGAGMAVARPLEELKKSAARFERNAHADATKRNYQRDWDDFEAWCLGQSVPALPASPETLRCYLAHLAELGRAYSTIRHARSSIGLAHKHARLPRPDDDPSIRMLERGIARELGSREVGVAPLLEHELARAVAVLRDGPLADRDRALLLVGFAGALRASELAGLDMGSVRFLPDGAVRAHLRRSKEDQVGRGKHVDIPRGQRPETCPVEALRVWIARVGRSSGPLFRVVRGAVVGHERISRRAVARAVQRAAARAGIEGHFAAHSLRSGLATSAYAAGTTEREIQVHGRWKDRRSLDRYIDVERMPGRRNVADGLL